MRSRAQGCELDSRSGAIRTRAFWSGFAVLAALAGGYGAVLAALSPDDAFTWPLAAFCSALALPVVALIAWLETRWVAHRVDELEQLIARQHRFVADAAHELRTPLTAQSVVGGNVLCRKATTPELREAVGSMLEESKHMTRLIDGLLELARISCGHAGARVDPDSRGVVELGKLVQGCVQALQILAEERGQHIELASGPRMWAEADATLVRQAVLNIVHNAIEHCPQGTRIRIETENCAGEEGVIRVIDNGPGIPPKDQPRVFERFYRGTGGSRRRGLGLGLSIARAVIRAQGGRIQLHSVPGEGCTFTLAMPLVDRPMCASVPCVSMQGARAAVHRAAGFMPVPGARERCASRATDEAR
jgi:two-component system OmpR family sensor kinase